MVRIWNVAKGTLVVGPTSSSTNEISSLAWSPDGTLLAIARNGENPRWFFGTSVRPGRARSSKNRPMRTARLTSWPGRRMGSNSWQPPIWPYGSGMLPGARLVRTLDSQNPNDQAPRLAAAWSPDGKRIATLFDNEKVRFFDSTYKPVVSGEVGGRDLRNTSVAWSPDGRHLAAACLSGCHVLDTDNGLREFGIDGLFWGDPGFRSVLVEGQFAVVLHARMERHCHCDGRRLRKAFLATRREASL